MNKQELKSKIEKLEKGIASKATPENLKSSLKTQKEKFEKELSDLEKKEKSELSKKVKDLKASTKTKSPKRSLKKDGERKAKKAGKRISADGNVYYEKRANRVDTQTKKKPYLEKGGELEGMHANIYRSDYDSPTNKLYGKKNVIIVDGEVPKIFEADSQAPAVRLVRRNIGFGKNEYNYIHAVPVGIEDGRAMMGGTFIYSSDSRFPAKYPIPLHDRVESYEDGGEVDMESKEWKKMMIKNHQETAEHYEKLLAKEYKIGVSDWDIEQTKKMIAFHKTMANEYKNDKLEKGGRISFDPKSIIGKSIDDMKVTSVEELPNEYFWVTRETYTKGLTIEQGFSKDDLIKLSKGEKVEGLKMMAKGGSVKRVPMIYEFKAILRDEDDKIKEKKEFKVKAIGRDGAYNKAYKKYPKPYFVELYNSYAEDKMAKGGDLYDDMDEDIEFANKKAKTIANSLKNLGYTIIEFTEANYDTDAEIKLSDKVAIQIGLEGDLAISIEKESGIYTFIDCGKSYATLLQKLSTINKDYMEKGGKTPRTVKLTLSDKDSYDYTYKQDGTTASITFAFGKEPFQYEVKNISKSLEPLKQDILDAFTIQGIKQHEYKGGFSEAIKHLDTKVVYEKDSMEKGGSISNEEYEKLNRDYNKYAALYEDAIGEEKEEYKKELERLSMEIHKAERGYKKGGYMADGGNLGTNIDVFGYETMNFDICPIAVEEFEKAVDKLNQTDSDAKKTALSRAAMYVDDVLGVEKRAEIDNMVSKNEFQYAVTQSLVASAYNYASGLEVNLSKFIPMHISKIASYLIDIESVKQEENIFREGGSIEEGNFNMVINQAKAIKHHADELLNELTSDMEIEAWVVGKIERASTDLSDITHYLDGLNYEKKQDEYEGYMADGGTLAERTKVEVGDEKISVIKNRKEKTGFPLYIITEGYAPTTLDVYVSKELANKKAKQLSKKQGYKFEDGGMMAKGDIQEKINNILSSNKNTELYTFIKPVDFILNQAFAQDVDLETIIYEVEKEIEFQIERSNYNKELRLIFAKVIVILKNAEAGFMADGGMMAKGGKLKELLSKAKSATKKVYEKSRDYTKKQVHDQKKKIALDVIDDTKKMYKSKYAKDNLQNAESLVDLKYVKGGKVKFEDKVKAIKASLLKNKKVPARLQKDYGKTYNSKEAEQAAKRIAGAMRKKEMK